MVEGTPQSTHEITQDENYVNWKSIHRIAYDVLSSFKIILTQDPVGLGIAIQKPGNLCIEELQVMMRPTQLQTGISNGPHFTEEGEVSHAES